ncbi:MAG: glycosyltransferase family 4 protein [Euryarchaeota archaeon]|nr:glycosyltransferase family 4 protein [Euryarchaeota archaeon]
MKIAFVPEFYIPHIGGGEVWAHQVAKELAKRGHEVHVYTYRHSDQRNNGMIDGVFVHRKGLFVVNRVQAHFKRAFSQIHCIFGELISENFDIIHSNQFIPLIPSFVVSKIKKVPIVATFHDIYFKDYWINTYGPFWGTIANLIEKTCAKPNYDAIIAVSHSTKQKLIKIGCSKEKIDVIYGGVDLELYDSINQPKIHPPQICYIGRLIQHKHVDVLISAFFKVLKKVPEAQLVIVGSGPEKKRLEDLSKRLGISEDVNFVGKVSEIEKIRILKASQVFVSPSTMEGFGLTLIEAMACLTPSIAVRIPATREIIKEDDTGFLVEPNSIGTLANVIIKLLQDEDLQHKIGQATRKVVEEKFTWKKTVDKLEKIYCKL